MDNDNKNERFRLTELIMVNPFDNWEFSFVGSVCKVGTESVAPTYFGVVEIDNDVVCCVSSNKDKIAKILEFIYTLKFKRETNKLKVPKRTYMFFDINLN